MKVTLGVDFDWPTPKPSRNRLAGVFGVVVRRRISGAWERLGAVTERRVLKIVFGLVRIPKR